MKSFLFAFFLTQCLVRWLPWECRSLFSCLVATCLPQYWVSEWEVIKHKYIKSEIVYRVPWPTHVFIEGSKIEGGQKTSLHHQRKCVGKEKGRRMLLVIILLWCLKFPHWVWVLRDHFQLKSYAICEMGQHAKHCLALLILAMVSFVSFAFISSLIIMISFLLLTLGFFIFFFF